jgi:hypothetical protein
VVDYGPFSLCVIHKEGLCPSSGDIDRLMMNIFRLQAQKGTLLIDSSTVDPNVPKQIFPVAIDKGVGFIDAPVSGGK